MNIFNFSNSSVFLKEYVRKLPRRGHGEVSRIAEHLGVSSTLVSHVLSGDKTFTFEQAFKLTKYLGLIDLEAEYFLAIHHYERAGTADYKSYWSAKMNSLREQSFLLSKRLKEKGHVLSEQERAIYYSSYLYPALRLYSSVGESGQSIQNLASRFKIPVQRCAEIMRFLVAAGFCFEEDGFFKMGQQSTHLEKGSPHLLRFQTDWRMKGIYAAEGLSEEELLFTGPVSLSKADFKKLREEMIKFINSFLETVHASQAEEIACLNIDWFWIR